MSDLMRAAMLVALMLTTVSCNSAPWSEDRKVLVCTVTPLDHPSLGAAIRGFEQGLKSASKEREYEIRAYNAAGDPQLVAPLLRQTVRDGCSLVFVVTTTTAQMARRLVAEQNVPVIFTAVTDPLGAEIVTSRDGKEVLPITGFTDKYPTARQVALFLELAPQTRTAAILFDPKEQNSQILVAETSKLLEDNGIRVLKFGEGDPAQVFNTAIKAARQADILIVNGDNLYTEQLESVVRAGRQERKPLFVGDPDSVRRGGVATIGPDYEALGEQSGVRAANVLAGAFAGKFPIEDPSNFDIVINVRAARDFGLSVPPSAFERPLIWSAQEQVRN